MARLCSTHAKCGWPKLLSELTERAGRGIGALNPTFVGLLSATLTLGQSIGTFAAIAYGLVIIAAFLMPETGGREPTAEG